MYSHYDKDAVRLLCDINCFCDLQGSSDEEEKEEEEEAFDSDDLTGTGSKRKVIRKIMKQKKLSTVAQEASKAEEDRRARIKERQKLVS